MPHFGPNFSSYIHVFVSTLGENQFARVLTYDPLIDTPNLRSIKLWLPVVGICLCALALAFVPLPSHIVFTSLWVFNLTSPCGASWLPPSSASSPSRRRCGTTSLFMVSTSKCYCGLRYFGANHNFTSSTMVLAPVTGVRPPTWQPHDLRGRSGISLW